MSKHYLDSDGLAYVWDKIRGYFAKKQDVITGTAGQVVGFDTEGKPVAQDLPDAATKEYVDGRFHEVAPVLVGVELLMNGHTMKTYYVKAYPAETEIPSYSLNFTIDNRYTAFSTVRIRPPEHYAFTGIYQSSGLNMYFTFTNSNMGGRINTDGTIVFVPDSSYDGEMVITGSFILEVE